jgi:glutamate--cysteine ligase
MNLKQEIKELKHGGMKSLIKKATELGIKISFLSYERPLIKLEHEGKTIFIRKGTIPLERRMGDMTKNKSLTKAILREVGIKTPKGIAATSFNEAVLLAKKSGLSYPLIVKPIDGSLATGVTWDIHSKSEIKKAINMLKKNKSFQGSKKFLLEEMFIGDEFRILVFGKKVISCVKKIPASIIGDGKSTTKKLIESFNKTRMKGFEIKIDAIVKNTFKKNKLTLDSVLPKSFNLKLRHNLNMSDGGRCVEYTSKMSHHFKKICEETMKTLGLTYGGIDFMTKDITDKNSNYAILEVNPNPYYNMHEKPLIEGKGIDVSSKILRNLFA